MPFFTSFSGKILSAPGLKLGPKIFQFIKTFTSNVQEYNLRNDLLANGWDGVTPVSATLTVNSGVYIWSDSTSTAAFNTGTLVSDSIISIINNGYIIGKGGNGGTVPTSTRTGTTGSAGGPAMDINYSVSITNNSYIAGGGGGGGSVYGDSAGRSDTEIVRAGAGGGAGGGNGSGGAVGGSVGSTGSNGSSYHGGAGGRILPGTGGATAQVGTGAVTRSGQGGGSGGSGGGLTDLVAFAPPQIIVTGGAGGGGGGGWGASGGLGHYAAAGGYGYYTIPGEGGSANNNGGNGSGLPNANYPNITTASGGAGGKAVNLNGNTVTWVATGTRYGAIS